MERDRCVLIVFAKKPIAGQVKTRLMTRFDADTAMEIHQQLVLHTLEHCVDARSWSTQLWCAPDFDHAFFYDCARDFDVTLVCQQGADLGRRMAFACREVLKRHAFAVIIGTDCPLLNTANIEQMFSALKSSDAVLTPAEDGGYVALGLKQVDAQLFANIAWGESSVLQQTKAKLADLKWRVHEFPVMWDVDYPADYDRAQPLLKC